MADFLASVANAAANQGSSMVSNFLQPIFDNYYTDMTTRNRGENYNRYADMTYPEDSRRMLNRLDTLYPGTTPWERLGIQPAASPSLPDSRAPGSTPFLLAQMQQETALKTTEMNNETALKQTAMQTGNQMAVAELGANTQLEIQRVANAFNLPAQQADIALKNAQQLQTGLQGLLTKEQITQTQAQTGAIGQQVLESEARVKNLAAQNALILSQTETEAIRRRVMESADLRENVVALNNILPSEKFNLPGFEHQGKKGNEVLQSVMTQLSEQSAANAFMAAPNLTDQQTQVLDQAIKNAIMGAAVLEKIIGMAGQTGDAANSFLGKPYRAIETTRQNTDGTGFSQYTGKPQ